MVTRERKEGQRRPRQGRPRYWILLLAVAAFLSCAGMVCAGNAPYNEAVMTNRIQTLYNTSSGLPANEANVVLQTGDGYLWIGSYGGLIRYDGTAFRNYSAEENGLDSSGIRALFEDDQGRLWVGTNDKGAYVFAENAFTRQAAGDQELYQSVRCFAQDGSGPVYVGTSTGLVRTAEGGNLEPVEVEELKNQTIYNLSFDGNGALWGTAGEGYAFCLKDDILRYWFPAGVLSEYENYSAAAAGEYIYIGTSANSLLRLRLRDEDYGPASYIVRSFDTGDIRTINALFCAPDGEIWIGGDTGYGWFDKGGRLHTLHASSRAAFINHIARDYEGNFWLASTQGGVYRIASGKFLNANAAAGLEGHSVNAAVRLDGLFYAATDDGLLIADRNFQPVENELTGLLDGVRIRHLLADSAGNLWIGTYSAMGLLRYTPSSGETKALTEEQGLLSSRVRQVLELKNGDLAVASTGGVNILHGTDVIQSFGQEQGMINTMALCLLELQDGTLLAGSDGQGIYAIRDGRISNIYKENGLSSGVVLRMREDAEAGGVWVSAGDSLFFLDQELQARPIDFRRGNGSIFDILVMEDELWLMKSGGLILVPRSSLLDGTAQEAEVTEYGAESGLTAAINSNSWSLFQDGVLYLCTSDGIFLFDRSHPSEAAPAPKTAINEIRISLEGEEKETVLTGDGPVKLPGNTRRVTIQFACLSFGPAPCAVEYYLEGFDQSPVRVSAADGNTVSYTNLRGGRYVFHLQAVNSDGAESGWVTAVTLDKTLRLTERPVFWAVLIVLTLLVMFLGIHLFLHIKMRRLRLRQMEYREITDQALRTIANTIDAKDSYTNGHSMRVARYSREIARRLGMSGEEQEQIYYAALLHDIGKIGVPDAILKKPGRLEDWEFDIMRKHTIIGGDILKDFTALPNIGQGALCHHERFDGGGYPAGLKGRDGIPLIGRIICAADSYDAMATTRSYRSPCTQEYILAEFQSCSGAQFDPQIAEIMIAMIREGFCSVGLENLGDKA